MGEVNVIQSKTYQIINKIRNGETVTCPACGKGEIKATGNPSVSHYFSCTHCGKGVNIN